MWQHGYNTLETLSMIVLDRVTSGRC